MSFEPERIFSGARCTISWDRAKLYGWNIECTKCLKSWIRNNLTVGRHILDTKVTQDKLVDGEVNQGNNQQSDQVWLLKVVCIMLITFLSCLRCKFCIEIHYLFMYFCFAM